MDYIDYKRLLLNLEDQPEELCIEAVKYDGYILEYIKTQTEEMCLEAVKENGYALQYVKNKTSEICSVARKQNKNAEKYIIKNNIFYNKKIKNDYKSFYQNNYIVDYMSLIN